MKIRLHAEGPGARGGQPRLVAGAGRGRSGGGNGAESIDAGGEAHDYMFRSLQIFMSEPLGSNRNFYGDSTGLKVNISLVPAGGHQADVRRSSRARV